MRASRTILVSMLALGHLVSVAFAARAERQPEITVEYSRTVMRCATGVASGELRSFVLELNTETTAKRPLSISTTVGDLGRSIESPPPRDDAAVRTGSWRVIDAGGRREGIFDPASMALCARGCALHEAASLDTIQWVLMVAKPGQRPLDVRWDLKDVEKAYSGTPFAIVAWVGYGGDYYVLRNLADTMSPEKGSCKIQTSM